MSKVGAILSAVAVASASFASTADLENFYNELSAVFPVELTESERAFHLQKFNEYMSESRLTSVPAIEIFQESLPAITEKRVKEIVAAATFETDASAFKGKTVREIKRVLGSKDVFVPLTSVASDFAGVPESFDSQQAWPKCTMIDFPRDQGNCGSCWAMATVAAFNDRLCINHHDEPKADPRVFKLLSTAHMATCYNSGSCEGGYTNMAAHELRLKGVPTGGEFEETDSGETCMPYPLHPCAHHVEGSPYPDCSVSDVFPDGQTTPKCQESCSSSAYPKGLNEDIFRAKEMDISGVTLQKDVLKSIATYGPVAASFSVYEDFLLYKSGVYTPSAAKGSRLGGHAIKVVGWGEENGTKYWRAVNSWNEHWGEQGAFRVNIDGVFGSFTGVLTNKHLVEEVAAETIRM